MINSLLTKIIGTRHDREIKRMEPLIEEINALEPEIRALDDEALRAKTREFRARLADGETIDDLLVPAFAVVREAARRTLDMRHYDVQLKGGIVLHRGKIAEMRTGEGKTLVATLPVYLNALSGNGVHVVTVNDYLAGRDAEWMGRIYRFLGMTVGVIQSNMAKEDRRKAYASDITYATNNELGFDYLRDNMEFRLENMVQRGHHYAIVDEVDSILIDEARTPLIISGPADQAVEKYGVLNQIARQLERGEEHEEEDVKYTTGDFLIDEKNHTVTLTDDGVTKAEKLLQIDNLYDMENIEFLHGLHQALRAHYLYKRDVDYLVRQGEKGKEVVIVDEFTGRMMPGRRWSDGLHQAVEAKEGVRIERENQTLATITFQNFFRMYDKLAGMTGTAETEEAEFGEIYDLDVTVVPTNRPMIRQDNQDVIFLTPAEKWKAVVEEIVDCYHRGQPVLVGTASIENSEMLAVLLKKRGIKHVVLNAKFHDREARIVAQAGRLKAVTIATNMAGRGTDIVLGGNPEELAKIEAESFRKDPDPEAYARAFAEALERYKRECRGEKQTVLDAGGLHILGTERHESRRIDNQLRGRSGRQGDPGSSRFYLSLQDDLMRIFASDKVQALIARLGLREGEAIEHGMVTKAIERAQKQVEARNFDVRKHLLQYDDVMNKQREEVYERRRAFLDGEGNRAMVMGLARDILEETLATLAEQDPEEKLRDAMAILREDGEDKWKLGRFETAVHADFDVDVQRLAILKGRKSLEGIDLERLELDLRDEIYKETPEERKLRRLAIALRKYFDVDIDRVGSEVVRARKEVAERATKESGGVGEEATGTATEAGDAAAAESEEAEEAEARRLLGDEELLAKIEDFKRARQEKEFVVDDLRSALLPVVDAVYAVKEQQFGTPAMRGLERDVMLQVLDGAWKNHLLALDHLKEGIGLRGYGQKDPLQEYKRESFDLFQEMKIRYEDAIVSNLFRFQPSSEEQRAKRERQLAERARHWNLQHAAHTSFNKPTTVRRQGRKIGRNEPCPCGSGKKYKHCCLKQEQAA